MLYVAEALLSRVLRVGIVVLGVRSWLAGNMRGSCATVYTFGEAYNRCRA